MTNKKGTYKDWGKLILPIIFWGFWGYKVLQMPAGSERAFWGLVAIVGFLVTFHYFHSGSVMGEVDKKWRTYLGRDGWKESDQP